MVRKIYFLAILLLSGGLILSSCTKEEELSSKKEVLSFVFEDSKNTELEQNIIGTISGTDITATVPFGTATTALIPTIEISPNATLNPASGVATDFSDPVTYVVTAEDGSTKEFTVNVPVEPAPYIGSWSGGPIDFGLGLMHINLTINEAGEITMELEELLTHEINAQSIKGSFSPEGETCCELLLNQTHRWIGGKWTEESKQRTFMYTFESAPKMRFYYCNCYPKQEWWFQIELTPQ
jgi:hypothetical protein